MFQGIVRFFCYLKKLKKYKVLDLKIVILAQAHTKLQHTKYNKQLNTLKTTESPSKSQHEV